jgi:hypothetical protein
MTLEADNQRGQPSRDLGRNGTPPSALSWCRLHSLSWDVPLGSHLSGGWTESWIEKSRSSVSGEGWPHQQFVVGPEEA